MAVNIVLIDNLPGGQSDSFGRHRLEISGVQYGSRKGPKGNALKGEGSSFGFVKDAFSLGSSKKPNKK